MTRTPRSLAALVAVACLALALALPAEAWPGRWRPTPTPAGAWAPPPRTKTSGCVARGPLPDAACSPGAVLSVDLATLCTPGYTARVRNVPQSEKDAVYAEYGITAHAPGEYEVDHLVSLELSGSNDLANLWPEPYHGPQNAHEKDRAENAAHAAVCHGKMTLVDAQRQIATDWTVLSRQLVGPLP